MRRRLAALLALLAALGVAAGARAAESPPQPLAPAPGATLAGTVPVTVRVAPRADPGDLVLRVLVSSSEAIGAGGALAAPAASADLGSVPAGFPGGDLSGTVSLDGLPAGPVWWQPVLADTAGTVVAAGPVVPATLAAAPPAAAASPAIAIDGTPTLKEVARRAGASVVRVTAVTRRRVSVGSGFLVGPRTILTNSHVVGLAPSVRVRGVRGPRLTARVVSRDRAHDLALLRLPRGIGAAALPFAATAREGDEVVAVGFPYGGPQTSSGGRVRSVLRSLTPGTSSLVETTIPLYPGSSGGPILDATGRVVGVVVAGQLGLIAGGGTEGTSFGVAWTTARAMVARALHRRPRTAPGT